MANFRLTNWQKHISIYIWHASFIMCSEMSHPRCVYINNRCRYQSITQQYLKGCLIKDDNYMFRPIAATIRFSSESMVVVLHRIGMVMSRWWDLNIFDVCYMLLLMDTGGDLWCALSWGVQLKYICSLLSYVGLQLLFVHFQCLLLVGFCCGLCVLSILRIRGDLCVQSV